MHTAQETENLFADGMSALMCGDNSHALECFEKLTEARTSPLIDSFRAVCLARVRGEYERAGKLCHRAMEREPGKSVHYLNLGRVYLAEGRKREAIRTFRDGLLYEDNQTISDELARLGWRDLPVIPALPRESSLNVFLGRILKKFNIRI